MTKETPQTVDPSPLGDGLDGILSNVLWFYCKWDSAPMSAKTHLDKAIVDLLALCPAFKTENKDISEIINEAKEHMRLLGYAPNAELI